MDPWYGICCYYFCILDLLGIGAGYAYAQLMIDGQLLGRWRYRLFKTLWLISAIAFSNVAVWAAVYTFGGVGALIRAILSAFVIILRLDFRFTLVWT